MRLEFTKMHGLGNDFVVIDAINQDVRLTGDQVRFIADRHFGIGCDQLLLVERPRIAAAEFRYRIFNADGGEVQQCGNGARCFARFVTDKGLTGSASIAVETAGGMIYLGLEEDGQVTVDMGVPSFEPASLPFDVDESAQGPREYYQLVVNGENYAIGAVSVGNPHAVLLVDSVDEAPVDTLGPAIESHERFPERVNVGFMEVLDRSNIRLRVFERAAGETLACGTGACAAVAVGVRNSLLDSPVAVRLSGGKLTIRWAGGGGNLFMTGPAQTVYEGKITL
jgi:diaminopimelate epimerase